jgi:hypothetical protein
MTKRLMMAMVLLGSGALAAPAAGQQQKVVPPKTVYWMSAATQTGFGMTPGATPSVGQMMRMGMGGGGGTLKLLDLDIGSKLPSSGPPLAEHAIPPAMNMGASLPLRAPARVKPGQPGETPPEYERPKGKVLIFWGCGETARAGQPVVFDFAKLAAGQVPPNLFASEQVRIQRPPSQSGWPLWARWPNEDRANGSRAVPANASLLGAHKITGSFVPPMEFTLARDWLQGVALTQAKTPAGAVTLSWNAVPGATAHFAQMIGGRDEGGAPTLVFWTSSDSQTFFSGLSDYIAPGEAARLVARKQLMPPTQTSCAIPRQAVEAAQGGLVAFTSHGPEENLIHPPRPKDPKQDWVQEWAVKTRFASRSGAILGMEGVAGGAPTASGKPRCPADAATEVGKGAGGVLGGGLGRAMGGALGGLMGGKKKKPPEDCEP